MVPNSRSHFCAGYWLVLALLVAAHPAAAQHNKAQGGLESPAPLPSSSPTPALSPLPARSAFDRPNLPSGADPAAKIPSEAIQARGNAAYTAAQDRLVDQAIPIEDQVIGLLLRMADDAEADLEDILEEMAKTQEERAALRARKQQLHEQAQEAERHRRMEQQAQRKAAREARRDERNAAREAREERREALREARARERQMRREARENARNERAARRAQRQAARHEAREARRAALEQRQRKSHLVISLVTAVLDQFNAVEGPQAARVASILDQIDAQAAPLKPSLTGSDASEKEARDFATLSQQLQSLRQIWADFRTATSTSPPGGTPCTKCD